MNLSKLTLNNIIDEIIVKMVFSKPVLNRNKIFPQKISARRIEASKGEIKYQFEFKRENKIFHENIKGERLSLYLSEKLKEYRQTDIWCRSGSHYIIYSSERQNKDHLKIHKAKDSFFNTNNEDNQNTSALHNREKNYIIQEGSNIPILVELGIFNKDFKLINGMNSKFKQINRFIEITDNTMAKFQKNKKIKLVDFGCGKSYLTFVLYYYLKEIKNFDVEIFGVDLKQDVIEYCSKLAEDYEYHGLKFCCGDIKNFADNHDFIPNVVVSLHGCDTATDYAIYNAIQWNVDAMFIAPCCQHELNMTISNQNLGHMMKFGVLKERFASILTDALRCNMVESENYKVDLIEFVNFSHSPKNLLIRAEKAVHTSEHNSKIIKQVEQTMRDYSVNHKLYELLHKKCRDNTV